MEMKLIEVSREHIWVELGMQGGVEKLDVMGLLKIDENNLDKEMMEQPSWFCFFSTILAQMESITERAKMALSVLEAEMGQKIRLKAIEEKAKAPTGDSIESTIMASKEHIALKTILLDCKEKEGIFHSFVDAWAQRKDMLKAIAGRTMYEKDLSVMKKNI